MRGGGGGGGEKKKKKKKNWVGYHGNRMVHGLALRVYGTYGGIGFVLWMCRVETGCIFFAYYMNFCRAILQ